VTVAGTEQTTRRPRKRRILLNAAGIVVALAAIVGALALWANSAQFERMVRHRLEAEIENATGGRAEIASFKWKLFRLEFEAGGIVIHGDEPANESPYARIDRLRARINLLGFWWSPRVQLRELIITRPRLHLILYRDGATNQPHPARRAKSSGGSPMQTLFNLQAGHVAIDQGLIDIDDRAADVLDARNRYQPLDVDGNDVSVSLAWVPAAPNRQESYRIDAAVRDLDLTHGGALAKTPSVHAWMQASLDLLHDSAELRSFRVTARTKSAPDRTLNITGALSHFSAPQWHAIVRGDLDLHLLDPVLGYSDAPEGIAHLDLTSGGENRAFRIDGTVNVQKAAYIGTGVTARGMDLATKVHADNHELHITSIAARLQQGGEIDGELLLENWLPASSPVIVEAAPPSSPKLSLRKRLSRRLHPEPPPALPPVKAPPHSTLVTSPLSVIPVNGKVNAIFRNVSVNTVLDLVSRPPFQRLGIAALLNGPANAVWTHGDVRTLSVTSNFALSPAAPAANEAPGSGVIDATYTQKDGAVELRQLDLHLPASHFAASGRFTAYPLTDPASLTVDFHSGKLSEFDTVFRDLGLARDGKTGVAALPVNLEGQADFRGNWTGSLASPRLNGQLQATQVSFELPPSSAAGSSPHVFRWDSIEAEGSYDAEHIAIVHGQLHRGQAQILVDGTLTAAPSDMSRPGIQASELSANSILHMTARAHDLDAADVMPLAGIDAPITGALDARITADGPLNALGGAGWLQLNKGTLYQEPVTTVRLEGALKGHLVTIASATATSPAGTARVQGSYDLDTRRFDMQANSTALDLARLQHVGASMPGVAGRLGFALAAKGTSEDPSIEGHGAIDGLSVRGQSFGRFAFTARTADHALVYMANTGYDSAELSISGQTDLRTPYSTQARLDFSRFDIAAIFRIASIQSISAQSALSGTAQVAGPLAHPDQMRGDFRVQQVAATVAGVHLQSEGGLHAALDNGRLTLDPLHITGDNTNLRAQGTVGLTGAARIDFAAGGSINLKLLETLDPDVTASGDSRFQVEAHGPLANPDLRGQVEFQNGALALEDLPNGLSQIQGTLEFNQNRLEVRSLTAMTGGGKLSLGGFLAYQHGIYASLTVSGQSVRIRYPQGVSSLADAQLQLVGTQSSLLLSGNILITRFSVSPDLDIAALAQQANAVQSVAAPNAPSKHVRLDVRILSSPQLNFQNAYAKLAGDVDLRLRGTVASPSLQGRISVTEGAATIAGTRYELQRGDITFTNPVRIQPNIDISATARVEDYDISLGLHGTPDKLAVSYRSDPPLPEADVIALLALGRTQSSQGLYTQQQQETAGLNPSTDVLLGGALNATVSSRVQKLFGAGSVKVDPSYLTALGNSTTRITVEEQLGKYVTITYATNVDTTAQQLLQADIAINRHVSLQLTRDESGVVSMVVKAIRRYR